VGKCSHDCGNVPIILVLSPQLWFCPPQLWFCPHNCGFVPTTVVLSPQLWFCPQFSNHDLFLLLRHLITSHFCLRMTEHNFMTCFYDILTAYSVLNIQEFTNNVSFFFRQGWFFTILVNMRILLFCYFLCRQQSSINLCIVNDICS